MSERYFVEQPIAGPHATLLASEAHHLAHVMRGKPGQQVTIFDGRGGEYTAEIARVGRAEIELSVLSHQAIERELPIRVAIGVSLPKGDRQRWLVEKLVELGVSEFVPLVAARGVAQPTGGTLERLRRAVIEAAKQCGRNRLMQVAEPHSFDDFVRSATPESLRLLAHPRSAAALRDFLRNTSVVPEAGLACAVGPEGGFTDDEIARAIAAGWTALDLGARILRVETAAAVFATAAGLLARG
ncbi:MAG TPA: 16S rRNA (uracil(1498)-N(3))-methyltransferase [Pirellulales bacterium]|nr:16S rRNA (uracil(1498)-N(3))-methyltransferase [Pirellulales bacterium]